MTLFIYSGKMMIFYTWLSQKIFIHQANKVVYIDKDFQKKMPQGSEWPAKITLVWVECIVCIRIEYGGTHSWILLKLSRPSNSRIVTLADLQIRKIKKISLIKRKRGKSE